MKEDRAEILKQLKPLQESYVRNLPKKLAQIEAAWQQVRAVPDDADRFYEFYRHVHNLAGSGLSLGLRRIGERAGMLESDLTPFIAGGMTIETQTLEAIDRGLAEIRAAAREDARIEEPDPLRHRRAPGYRKPTGLGERPLIYVVLEDRHGLEKLCLQIENFGFGVEGYATTDSFERRMAEQMPQVVIMDHHFDDQSRAGFRSLKRMRAQYGEAFELLCLTEHDDFKTRMQAGRHGAAGVFVNPWPVPEIVDVLDRLTMLQGDDPLRVLIVDDEAESADYHALILTASAITARTLTDPAQILQEVSGFMPDLILTDLHMPVCSGHDLAAVIRQIDAYAPIPIVYLSSEDDLKHRFLALVEGADDYMIKPVDPSILVNTVRLRAERFKSLRQQMLKDPLTGLLNHSTVIEHFERELPFARRRGSPLCVALIDIDDLKGINERYGYHSGDRIIKSLSRVLKQQLRKSDIVGRFGGKQFAAVLRDTPVMHARKVMEKILRQFAQIDFFDGGHAYTMTACCGIAADDEDAASSVVNRARDALRSAKIAGRHQIAVL